MVRVLEERETPAHTQLPVGITEIKVWVATGIKIENSREVH
jgi:hypothetical protein